MTPPVVLSFDVEEHHRIEAAAGIDCTAPRKAEYAARMESVTRRLVDRLGEAGVPATFFLVGELAQSHAGMVRAIHDAGHEVAAHGWDHRRVHHFTPREFEADVRQCKDALEQVTGAEVAGYRAPTFSVMRPTAWAVDVLAECGYRYDSSIVPVRHDRYGVPDAPRVPYAVQGREHTLPELPVATLRLGGLTVPAGGGYFRLFPLGLTTAAIDQVRRLGAPAVLYFHPWEFDPDQPRLPLGRLSAWRTYVGCGRTWDRLDRLIARHRGAFTRCVDVVADAGAAGLREFALVA
jgi:polysaccharide deacetylase family protein (PEP-CTERM system associated)